MKIQKTLIFLTFNFLTFNFIGQNTTVGGSHNKNEREPAAAHKVMLIPFESLTVGSNTAIFCLYRLNRAYT